jgi:phospholipase/lecithinase/hemolysin
MRMFGLSVLAFVFSASAAFAQSPSPLTAEEALSRVLDEPTTLQRDAWFDANAKGKVVAWTAPVFAVNPSFSIVIVTTRPTERGLVACTVPESFHAAAKKIPKGETVLCVGVVEDYERMLGAALINVTANEVIVGKDKIDAWQKAQKKSGP